MVEKTINIDETKSQPERQNDHEIFAGLRVSELQKTSEHGVTLLGGHLKISCAETIDFLKQRNKPDLAKRFEKWDALFGEISAAIWFPEGKTEHGNPCIMYATGLISDEKELALSGNSLVHKVSEKNPSALQLCVNAPGFGGSAFKQGIEVGRDQVSAETYSQLLDDMSELFGLYGMDITLAVGHSAGGEAVLGMQTADVERIALNPAVGHENQTIFEWLELLELVSTYTLHKAPISRVLIEPLARVVIKKLTGVPLRGATPAQNQIVGMHLEQMMTRIRAYAAKLSELAKPDERKKFELNGARLPLILVGDADILTLSNLAAGWIGEYTKGLLSALATSGLKMNQVDTAKESVGVLIKTRLTQLVAKLPHDGFFMDQVLQGTAVEHITNRLNFAESKKEEMDSVMHVVESLQFIAEHGIVIKTSVVDHYGEGERSIPQQMALAREGKLTSSENMGLRRYFQLELAQAWQDARTFLVENIDASTLEAVSSHEEFEAFKKKNRHIFEAAVRQFFSPQILYFTANQQGKLAFDAMARGIASDDDLTPLRTNFMLLMDKDDRRSENAFEFVPRTIVRDEESRSRMRMALYDLLLSGDYSSKEKNEYWRSDKNSLLRELKTLGEFSWKVDLDQHKQLNLSLTPDDVVILASAFAQKLEDMHHRKTTGAVSNPLDSNAAQ